MFAGLPSRDYQHLAHKVYIDYAMRLPVDVLEVFVAEWQEDIRTALPGIMECLSDNDGWVCPAAIEGLTMLGAQGVYCLTVFAFGILDIVCSRMARGHSNGNSWHCGTSEGQELV